MKKAVLTNRIFTNFDESLYEHIKKNLTYKVPNKVPGEKPIIVRTYKTIGHRVISIPIGRTDLIPDDYEIVDKRTLKPVEFPKFKFTLRPSQQHIYNKVDDNCIINANVSFGKTFTAIAVATKLKQKTLVIVHTVILRDQWKEEIEKTLGITPGIIGSGKLDYHEKPIVIANIQTLRKYTSLLKEEFGLVIVDECHHTPAKIFEETLNAFKARYKIGLSATLGRRDHLHVLLPDFFGRVVHKPPAENQLEPYVFIIKSSIPFNSNNMIPWANRVNELTARPEYLDLVTGTAEAFAEKGHKVLIVSDRVEFLDRCQNKLEARSVLVTSQTKDRDELHQEIELGNKDILNGSISIYKEGVSLNYLSCVILAAPINNIHLLDQLTGRIMRKYPDKLQPVVVDIVLKGNTARNQSRTRAGFYISKGWKILYADIT